MVSVHSNPHQLGQDLENFAQFYGCDYTGNWDAMKTAMNSNLLGASSYWNAGSGVEDPNKRIRKPYTITKSRECWSEQEHDKFLEALHLFDRDWKKIVAFVGSKTVIQIRSHAQKYFQKVLKNGKTEHVPPPRPKRKASHPYPQKAMKNGTSPSSATMLDSSVHNNPVDSIHLPPWTSTDYLPRISEDDIVSSGGTMLLKYSHDSNKINHQLRASNGTGCQVKEQKCKAPTGTPDFAQVYNFIGGVFDRSGVDHLRKLKKMEPINVWTVLMLMKNLSTNLMSPEFEYYRRLLSSSVFCSNTDSDSTSTIHFA